MTAEQLENFVNSNKFSITDENKLARCVDGRYENLDNFPAIAKPGADGGDVMAAFGAINLLGKNLPNEKVLDAVLAAVGGPGKFCFHTDEHSEHDNAGTGMGCGHMKKAKLEPDAYGLKQEQIDFLFDQLPKLVESKAHQEVLKGDHEETAVVVVESDEYSLKPLLRTESGVEEVFVYQKTLHEQQLDQITRNLQEAILETGEVVEESEVATALRDSFATQLTATLSRLAAGLPVYHVKITSDDVVINQ